MDILNRLHRLERQILPALIKHSSVEDISKSSKLSAIEVTRALSWLSEKKLVELHEEKYTEVTLGENGALYKDKGLPEKRVLSAAEKGVSSKELENDLSKQEINISLGLLRSGKLIDIQKGKDLTITITNEGKKALDKGFVEEDFLSKKFPRNMDELKDDEKEILQILQKRRDFVILTEKKKITATLTTDGASIAKSDKLRTKIVDRLTPQMIKSGSWENEELRAYDLNAHTSRIFGGKKQPYRRFLEQARQKFLALGFKEMDGPIVESEFWNMDALFMPQFHSARDIHDAYYVKDPKHTTDLPKDLLAKVKKAHESGIDGSKGWRYEFDEKKTSRLILRSHDTAISPRTLASKELQVPGKYFQISRCFRYDVIDATHNADFDQIGGFVVGEELTLRNLFWLLRLFAKEFCGTDDIKVVPAYFPFTEPSCSLYAKHPVMGWIELAGAGIFRPEMTKPLGVDKPVIAWGIGLGRVAMFNLGLKDIRQLYSYDLDYLRNAKVV